jgi:hypothetical protein
MSLKVRGIILQNTVVFYDVLFINKCSKNLEIKPDKFNVDTVCTYAITSSK